MASKMETMLAQYGRIGIIVYFSIFFLTLFGFWTLLTAGVDIRTWSFFSNLGDIGPIGLAYATTKINTTHSHRINSCLHTTHRSIFSFGSHTSQIKRRYKELKSIRTLYVLPSVNKQNIFQSNLKISYTSVLTMESKLGETRYLPTDV